MLCSYASSCLFSLYSLCDLPFRFLAESFPALFLRFVTCVQIWMELVNSLFSSLQAKSPAPVKLQMRPKSLYLCHINRINRVFATDLFPSSQLYYYSIFLFSASNLSGTSTPESPKGSSFNFLSTLRKRSVVSSTFTMINVVIRSVMSPLFRVA